MVNVGKRVMYDGEPYRRIEPDYNPKGEWVNVPKGLEHINGSIVETMKEVFYDSFLLGFKLFIPGWTLTTA